MPLLGPVGELLGPVLDAPLDTGAGGQRVVDHLVAGSGEEVFAVVSLAVVFLQGFHLKKITTHRSSKLGRIGARLEAD